ncbi:MAG: glutamine synthetase III, partial [Bacteroides sp.]
MSKMRFFALQELSNRCPLEVNSPSNKLSDYYGSHVFDRKKMQEYLPKEAFKAVVNAIEKGAPISREMAD